MLENNICKGAREERLIRGKSCAATVAIKALAYATGPLELWSFFCVA